MKTSHKIINGNSLDELPKLENNSVDLIITSPPYWQLKNYNHLDQIGYHDTYEEYISKLNTVFTECERVLKYGNKMCINIRDIGTKTSKDRKHRIIPIHSDIIQFFNSIDVDYMGTIWEL